MATADATVGGKGKIRLTALKGLTHNSAALERRRQLTSDNRQTLDGIGVQLDYLNEFKNYFVEFEVTPEITESAQANYSEKTNTRGAGSILTFAAAPSRTFSISGKLVSRTNEEVAKNAKRVHTLKSWRMPETLAGIDSGVDREVAMQSGIVIGSPTVLYLYGYGNMFKGIPVVMTDLSLEFTSEHDYIANGSAIMPIITSFSISLKEAHSLLRIDGSDNDIFGPFSRFDIAKYRDGTLGGW